MATYFCDSLSQGASHKDMEYRDGEELQNAGN